MRDYYDSDKPVYGAWFAGDRLTEALGISQTDNERLKRAAAWRMATHVKPLIHRQGRVASSSSRSRENVAAPRWLA